MQRGRGRGLRSASTCGLKTRLQTGTQNTGRVWSVDRSVTRGCQAPRRAGPQSRSSRVSPVSLELRWVGVMDTKPADRGVGRTQGPEHPRILVSRGFPDPNPVVTEGQRFSVGSFSVSGDLEHRYCQGQGPHGLPRHWNASRRGQTPASHPARSLPAQPAPAHRPDPWRPPSDPLVPPHKRLVPSP